MPAAAKSSTAKRTPFQPKPPRPVEERLPKLYRALTDQVEGSHFAGAIKTCKKILSLDPKSTAAFQTLLFLHLHTDDYTSALATLDSSDLAKPLVFERAYCLYRLHREREALKILGETSGNGRKEKHLEAQIKYRLGEYEGAQSLYDDLLASCDPSSSEHPDIVDNIAATSTHLDFTSHGYQSHLTAPPPSAEQPRHVPSGGDLETYVPSLPNGWVVGGQSSTAAQATKKAAPVKKDEAEKAKKKTTRHKLPKDAVEGKPHTDDPERWVPTRQRASYIAAQNKKKGAKESMGTGFTQGSTTQQQSGGASGGGGGGGGGGKNKKKGKK